MFLVKPKIIKQTTPSCRSSISSIIKWAMIQWHNSFIIFSIWGLQSTKKSESLQEFRVVASVNVLFWEKNPNSSFAFQWCHPNLIVMPSCFLNTSSWSSWNILTFGGFRWTLIISRTLSETFEKVKRSMEHVLISW